MLQFRSLIFSLYMFLFFCVSGCGPTFMLQGTVINDQQEAVYGAKVTAMMLQPASGEKLIQPVDAQTDDQGRYRLENLKAGEYRIEVEMEGCDPDSTTAVFTETKHLNFVLRQHLTITGVVYDSDGMTPVPEASVIVEQPRDQVVVLSTDFNGRFRCYSLEKFYRDESYTIRVFKDGRQAEIKKLHLDDNREIILILPKRGFNIPEALMQGSEAIGHDFPH